jgi:ADP-ribose pyrophosphatase YjhB (NUDIX family)
MAKPEKAVAVAAGAVLRQGRILLIRRNFEPFVGCWGMPGGKIHAGEHLEEAVEREVMEETGVRAKFERFCGVLSEKVWLGRLAAKSEVRNQRSEARSQNAEAPDGRGQADMHYVVLVSRLEGLTARVTESREGEVRWFAVADLAELKETMIPSDLLMLERFGILGRISPPGHHDTRLGGEGRWSGGGERQLQSPLYARCEIAKRRGAYRVVRFY